jgi:hypothetical protein
MSASTAGCPGGSLTAAISGAGGSEELLASWREFIHWTEEVCLKDEGRFYS